MVVEQLVVYTAEAPEGVVVVECVHLESDDECVLALCELSFETDNYEV